MLDFCGHEVLPHNIHKAWNLAYLPLSVCLQKYQTLAPTIFPFHQSHYKFCNKPCSTCHCTPQQLLPMVILQPNLSPGTHNSTPTFVHHFFFEPTIDESCFFFINSLK